MGFCDEEVEDHEVKELRTELGVEAEVALEGVVQDGLESERRHHLLKERLRIHHDVALLQQPTQNEKYLFRHEEVIAMVLQFID